MGIIGIGMQETDANGFDHFLPADPAQASANRLTKGLQYRAVKQHPFLDPDNLVPGYYVWRPDNIKVIESGPVLAPDKKNIFKPVRRDKQGFCPFAFQEGIGGYRAAMDNFQVVRQLLTEKILQPLEDGPGWIIRCGWEFVSLQPGISLQDKIGECTTSINA